MIILKTRLSIIEGWSYLDSWYFTVVSLTTIGFGDYAPSFITDSGFLSVYRMMALCWLLIGLAWLGGLLSLMTTLFGEIQNSIFIGPIKLKAGVIDESCVAVEYQNVLETTRGLVLSI